MNIDIDIHSLSVDEFKKYKLVDVREPEECDANPPISDKVDFIPLSEIETKLDFFNKDNAYLLYCAMGGRSHYLAEVLESKGIKALSVNNGIDSVNAYLKKNIHANSV